MAEIGLGVAGIGLRASGAATSQLNVEKIFALTEGYMKNVT